MYHTTCREQNKCTGRANSHLKLYAANFSCCSWHTEGKHIFRLFKVSRCELFVAQLLALQSGWLVYMHHKNGMHTPHSPHTQQQTAIGQKKQAHQRNQENLNCNSPCTPTTRRAGKTAKRQKETTSANNQTAHQVGSQEAQRITASMLCTCHTCVCHVWYVAITVGHVRAPSCWEGCMTALEVPNERGNEGKGKCLICTLLQVASQSGG